MLYVISILTRISHIYDGQQLPEIPVVFCLPYFQVYFCSILKVMIVRKKMYISPSIVNLFSLGLLITGMSFVLF
jgi:hypothetical protein